MGEEAAKDDGGFGKETKKTVEKDTNTMAVETVR